MVYQDAPLTTAFEGDGEKALMDLARIMREVLGAPGQDRDERRGLII